MIKNILVFGIGGVGGYFGGMLARNKKDLHITFIARGEHLEAIRRNGLILDTDKEKDLVCRPDLSVSHPEDAPIPDLCIIAVKGYDLDDVSSMISGHMKHDTVILPLMNGVDIRERIRKRVHTGLVLPACVYVSGNITAPGKVAQRGPAGYIIAGKDLDNPGREISDVATVFSEVGIDFRVIVDPYPEIWQKFLFITAYGLVTAWSRKSFGELLADPQLATLTKKIIDETAAVGRAKGIALPDDAEVKAMETGRKFPPVTRTSFQRDIEAEKSCNEGDLFGGTVLRLGKKFGVPTPATEKVYGELSGSIT